MNANLIFETLNGAWTIALTFIVVFVLIYLRESIHEVGLRTFLFDRSLPEQFAIAILISDVGNLIVRGSTWAWRNSGTDLGRLEGPLFWGIIIGATVGTLGILCKIRVISLSRWGHWPWLACLSVVSIFTVYMFVS